MVEFQRKVIRVNNNSYGIVVPKQLVDSKLLQKGKTYIVKVEEMDGQAGICTFINNPLISGDPVGFPMN